MNSENKMLNDWRLQTFSHLAEDWTSPWSGQFHPKGTRMTLSAVIALSKKKHLTISLPNVPALLLDASEKSYFQAKKIRAECGIDTTIQNVLQFRTDHDTFEYLANIMQSIIMGFTAIEAFVNESIPADYVYSRHVKSDVILESSNKPGIERQVSTDEKLCIVLPDIYKCASPKTSKCWSNYVLLKRVRDRVIHMKTEDRKSSGAEQKTIWYALLNTPSPAITAKSVIDYFLKHMEQKPMWTSSYPNRPPLL